MDAVHSGWRTVSSTHDLQVHIVYLSSGLRPIHHVRSLMSLSNAQDLVAEDTTADADEIHWKLFIVG